MRTKSRLLPGDADRLPPALEDAVGVLLTGSDAKARKAAADAILDFAPKDAVPPYAWLDRAGTCEAKEAVIEKIAESGDARALPACSC